MNGKEWNNEWMVKSSSNKIKIWMNEKDVWRSIIIMNEWMKEEKGRFGGV